MAGTTISDLGKLLAQNTQSVQGTDNTTRSQNKGLLMSLFHLIIS